MPPIFRTSKTARLLFNNADMSAILTDVQVVATVPALKTTVLQNADETYIPGIRDGTVKYSGLFDGTAFSTSAAAQLASTKALDGKFMAALQASTEPIITYGMDADAIGGRVRMFRQETVAYDAMSMASDVVKVAAAGQISGRQDYGVWLLPLSARTSTSSTFANVDSGVVAGTTLGGVGHFHMTVATTVITFRAKIQHSSAAASWADLITFSSSTGTTSAGAVQRTTVSGTVKRYTRAIISTYTGGGPKTATVAVAFARRNRPV